MLYFQMPMYFLIGVMAYLFPKVAIWFALIYLGLFLFRCRI